MGATLISADVSTAKAVLGAEVVQVWDFIGVTPASSKLASVDLAMIDAQWDRKTQTSRKELFQYLKEQAGAKEQSPVADQLFNSSEQKIEQTFSLDYIAHVPLEPRAGLAQWEGDQLTVWTGTQR